MIVATDTTHSDNVRAISRSPWVPYQKIQKGLAGFLAIFLAEIRIKVETIKFGLYRIYAIFFCHVVYHFNVLLIFNHMTRGKSLLLAGPPMARQGSRRLELIRVSSWR